MSVCLIVLLASALFSFSNRYEEEINRRTTVENEFVALKKVRSSKYMNHYTYNSFIWCKAWLKKCVIRKCLAKVL